MDLKGKTVLITGKWDRQATRALALSAAQRGAQVVLVSKKPDADEPLTRELRDGGKKAVVIQADVQKASELARMTHQTVAAFGRIDILMHHLGRIRSLSSPATARGAAQAALRKHLRFQQGVLPTLLRQKSGMIINVGEVHGSAPSDALGVLLTRIKGQCLQVQAIGALARKGAEAEPALKRRLGEAMGLSEYPCLQVRHLPNPWADKPGSSNLMIFLMDLISKGCGDSLPMTNEQG